jgi:cobalt-zinc-cadmium resistance protein CzcA
MALTMACALFGALVYALAFFPAVLVGMVPPSSGHGPAWMERLARLYERALPGVVRRRRWWLAGSAAALVITGWAFARTGAEFVPRIFEGDAVVTIRRAPSISLDEARRLDLEAERVLHRFPEVKKSLAMTGRAEVATDPVGNDNTDILVALAPAGSWTTAKDFDALSEAMKTAVERDVPGTFASVSQPIEDRTNELISGSRADVQIQIYGSDLGELSRAADAIGDRVRAIRGSGDVRLERLLGQPSIEAVADRARLARHGVRVEDAFLALQAAREGVRAGEVYEGERRFELRVLQPPSEASAEGLGDLFVQSGAGVSVPLREVVTLSEGEGPTAIRRQNRERAVRVDVNLRGRDLVSWVSEARAAVAKDVPLPAGYRVEWGGQFENFERAQARLAIVVPVVVAIIFGMLLAMFQSARVAAAVFLLVPLGLTGGMLGLLGRGLSFSLPAAVGFIALGGIAVLNGVVIANRVIALRREGCPLPRAVVEGPASVMAAVLTTGAVAALGFLPMALATGAGAEAQRPLATVVVVGMVIGTALTLLVLPGLLRELLPQEERESVPSAEEVAGPATAPGAPGAAS